MIPKEADGGTKLLINDSNILKAINSVKNTLEKIKYDIIVLSAKRDSLIEVIWTLEKIENDK